MKKSKKFRTFPILNIKDLLAIVSAIILIASILSAASFFISGSLNSDLLNLIVHVGIKKNYTPPKINIAQTMLSVSAPGIVFSESKNNNTANQNKVEPLVYKTQIESEILPLTENTAQSITYKSAEENGYTSVDGIYINNQTGKSVDIKQLLNKELDLTVSDDLSVLIVHTHTTESYTPSEKYNYIPTENDRTTDSNFNMVAVGEVIYNTLKSNGINVIHDKSVNDYPSYSTSYSKSLKLVESYTKKYPSIKIVIDVHRDAIVSKNGSKMRPVANLTPPCAQVMMVVGTNDSGLNHSAWQTNLSFAVKLQHKINSMYPTLARPINLRRERFNQHAAPYAFILEVGTNGNTLDEAKEGALHFSESLVSLLKN